MAEKREGLPACVRACVRGETETPGGGGGGGHHLVKNGCDDYGHPEKRRETFEIGASEKRAKWGSEREKKAKLGILNSFLPFCFCSAKHTQAGAKI